MFPHLPYADAVHAALADANLAPDTLSVNAPVFNRELTALLQWDDLALRWSSEVGWRYEAALSGGTLPLDRFAAPAAITAIVACLQQGQQPVASCERWCDAQSLSLFHPVLQG
jgi:hypothetical protein